MRTDGRSGDLASCRIATYLRGGSQPTQPSTEKEELNMKSQIQRGVKIGVVVLLLGISAYAAVTVVLAFGPSTIHSFSTGPQGLP